jgi:DNA-binding SARP family transcriptional activator
MLTELSQLEKAKSWVNRATGLSRQIKSSFLNFNILLASAELAFADNNDKKGLNTLSQAMLIGRVKNYLEICLFSSSAICDFCIRALEQHIEEAYVQKLIASNNLYPASPPLHLDNWPWKIRIYTLGRFGILHDGNPVNNNNKGKNKPVELLKALIAMGGRDVDEARLCEALWQDADGDNAHSSYTSTLSRLRKLLGSESLLVQNGQLSLNDRLCWLDTWAYYRALGELESMLLHSETLQMELVEKQKNHIFSLYHGLFMEKEAQMAWMLPERERLQTRLLRMIRQLIGFYSNRGHCKKVIALYEKAQELDPLSEEYYRGLMQCYASSGNNGKALAIYDNCRNILNATFAIQPSQKTTRLYNTIKSDDRKQLLHCCKLCSGKLSA